MRRPLAAAVMSVVLAGCGSGGSDSSPGTPMPAAQFGAPAFTALGGVPFMVFADFDRDGKSDAIASYDGKTLVYLHGSGDGTLQATHSLLGVAAVLGGVAADLNKDGNLDLVVLGCASEPCSFPGGVPLVYFGNGAGAFGIPTAYAARGESLAVGDFNGDGTPDLAVGRHDVAAVRILLGNGDGTLGFPVDWPTLVTLPTPPSVIRAADFNNDGKQDLLTFAGAIIVTASVVPGLGNGRFGTPLESGVGTTPGQVEVIDLNRDGKMDVVFNGSRAGTQPGPGAVTIMLGKGDGTFAPSQFVFDYPSSGMGGIMAVGDIDRDGIPDLAILGGLGELSLLYGKGDGTFLPHQNFPLPFTLIQDNSIWLVDMNGDGRLDLVIRNGTSLAVMLNTR